MKLRNFHFRQYFYIAIFISLSPLIAYAQSNSLMVSSNSRGERKIAAILINFQDSADDKPYTSETIKELIGGKVNDFFVENSYGKAWLNVDTFGWFTLPLDAMDSCPRNYREYANAAVEATGVDLSAYPHILYIVPKTNACNGSFGSVGGSPSTASINLGETFESNWNMIAHEIGHNFGLSHANGLICDGGAILDETCTIQGYGDKFSIMGIGNGHFNAYEKEKLGWIGYGSSTPPITIASTSGSYTISAIESFGTEARAVKILRGIDPVTGNRSWYYLEYRQPIGFDTYLFPIYDPYNLSENLNKGVIVHIFTEGNGKAQLLDMTPDSITSSSQSDLRDAALVIGDSYTDTEAGITITPVSVGSNGITVNISMETNANNSPIARNDSVKTVQDKAVVIDVLSNDSDPDGDRLSVTSVSGVNGKAVINSDNTNTNTITFTPVSGFIGVETFSYSISDGRGGSASASVSVNVDAIVVSNKAPTANFTYSCSDLSCSFKDISSDSDGTIVSRNFSFGDGASSTLVSPTHTYNLDGNYTVTLVVTDDDGAKDSISKNISVSAPADNGTGSSIELSATLSKNKGTKIVTLKWSGVSGSEVRIIKNGTLLVKTANDGLYEDTYKGKATHSYQVCEVEAGSCSAVINNQE